MPAIRRFNHSYGHGYGHGHDHRLSRTVVEMYNCGHFRYRHDFEPGAEILDGPIDMPRKYTEGESEESWTWKMTKALTSQGHKVSKPINVVRLRLNKNTMILTTLAPCPLKHCQETVEVSDDDVEVYTIYSDLETNLSTDLDLRSKRAIRVFNTCGLMLRNVDRVTHGRELIEQVVSPDFRTMLQRY